MTGAWVIYKKNKAFQIEKQNVKMRVYNSKEDCPAASVVYQETEKGHGEEFYHEKSYFVFYIIEGAGTWVIEGKEHPVETGDVVIVPPGKKFYYKGRLKQVCVTSPAWEEKYEKHVRDVQL